MKLRLRLVTLGLLSLATAGAADRPNVLFIAVDDLRPELGTYGARHIRSPHLDRLAATGMRFDRVYCQYPICGPSRASLLTGLRPNTLKIDHIDTFFRDTVPDVVTLPQHFKAHGYEAVSIGKVFHANQTDDAHSWTRRIPTPPARRGNLRSEYRLPESVAIVTRRAEEAAARFGSNSQLGGMSGGPVWEAADLPDDDYIDGRVANGAIEALRELKGKPFFLGVGFVKPHLPFVAPKKYFDLYDPAKLELPPNRDAPIDSPTIARHSSFELRTRTGVPTSGPIDDATTRELLRAYYACVSFVDAQIGRLLAELDTLGLRDNTIVVVWGDHGWHLGEYGIWGKATNHEAATRVPLIVRAPGQTPAAGGSSRALVEFIDIYPSLCELAGLPLPGHLAGRSFVPLLTKPDQPWKDAAFSQFPSPALREWAARPLSPAMRQTFFGPVIADVEARLKQEHGARYDPDLFNQHLMGYSLRTERYRYTLWVDRRKPDDEPLAVELYDHRVDPRETRNIARQPDQQALLSELRARLRQQLATP